MVLWNESFYNSFIAHCVIRYVFSLNFTWLVNSAAHIWGSHPFDKRINPAENAIVSFCAMGEGWHNYHHVFPWDYKAAELGAYGLNLTTFWIDLFAKIGWAYDLKEPSKELVRKTIGKYGMYNLFIYKKKTYLYIYIKTKYFSNSGDGSHPSMQHCHHPEVPPEEDENSNYKMKHQ